jgi:uncharacterized membrane protein YphA (DoxX/SURF4 family)
MTAESRGLLALRLCLGVFFLFEGINKAAWLLDPAPLATQLAGWAQQATPVNRWYLETVCQPGAALFARLVPLGEFAAGLAFLGGVSTRLAAVLALLMVINFHVASGAIARYQFLTNGYAFPVMGGLLALAIGGSASSFRTKRSPRNL